MRTKAVGLLIGAALLLLGGCASPGTGAGSGGGKPVQSPLTAGPGVRTASGPAAEQAARVAAAWVDSPTRQAWEHGYYPVEDTTEWPPKDAFHSGADKAAYYDGHVDLRTALPVTFSGAAQVQFPDGSRLTLPLRSAQDVYTSLTHRSDSCAVHCDARLTVSAVRPGTTTVATSRGRATIPVWEFTVDGYAEPFRYPAVLSQLPAVTRPAPAPTPPWAGDGSPTRLRSVSADGLVLTATVAAGCTTVLPGTVYETDLAVVLIGHTESRTLGPHEACAASVTAVPVEFRLSRPLGARTVLGLDDGQPQPPAPQPGAPQ